MGVGEGHLGTFFIWDAFGQLELLRPTNGGDRSVVPLGHRGSGGGERYLSLRSCGSYVTSPFEFFLSELWPPGYKLWKESSPASSALPHYLHHHLYYTTSASVGTFPTKFPTNPHSVHSQGLMINDFNDITLLLYLLLVTHVLPPNLCDAV